jgi:hypothetical protein
MRSMTRDIPRLLPHEEGVGTSSSPFTSLWDQPLSPLRQEGIIIWRFMLFFLRTWDVFPLSSYSKYLCGYLVVFLVLSLWLGWAFLKNGQVSPSFASLVMHIIHINIELIFLPERFYSDLKPISTTSKYLLDN